MSMHYIVRRTIYLSLWSTTKLVSPDATGADVAIGAPNSTQQTMTFHFFSSPRQSEGEGGGVYSEGEGGGY